MPFSWRIKDYLEELWVHAFQHEGMACYRVLWINSPLPPWCCCANRMCMFVRSHPRRVWWVILEDTTGTIHYEGRRRDAERVFPTLPPGFHRHDNERDLSRRSAGCFFYNTCSVVCACTGCTNCTLAFLAPVWCPELLRQWAAIAARCSGYSIVSSMGPCCVSQVQEPAAEPLQNDLHWAPGDPGPH